MTKAVFKQSDYDYSLTVAGQDSQLWFHISNDNGVVWAGSLRDLIENLLLGVVAKQQLQEDAVAIRNGMKANASLIAMLSKTHPGKIREFRALIEEEQIGERSTSQDTKEQG